MGGVAATLFTDWLLAEDYYRSSIDRKDYSAYPRKMFAGA